MNSVKRYDLIWRAIDNEHTMVEYSNGKWVLFADYEKLLRAQDLCPDCLSYPCKPACPSLVE